MRQERDKGSITVFLAVTFLFIMAMLGTLIDGARLVEANAQAYYAADLAAASALAQFNYKLKDRYGLFAYEDDPGKVIQQVAMQNMGLSKNKTPSPSEDLYDRVFSSVLQAMGVDDPARNPPSDLLGLRSVSASQAGIPVTLHNPNEFERQIFEYVKFRGAVELFQSNLVLDFTEISDELEEAENEDSVDEAMESLQEMLADHNEAKTDYNEALKDFKKKMKEIADKKHKPIVEKLENGYPSIEELSGLKSRMSGLSGALSIREDCSRMLEKIRRLEESRDRIWAAAQAMESRFTGAGDTAKFDGKNISGEMLAYYKEDLKIIRENAELKWEKNPPDEDDTKPGQMSDSTTEDERSIYRRLQAETKAIQTEIQSYHQRIVELEEEAESEGSTDEDEDDESLGEKIDKLWKSLKAHFGGTLYYGGDRGVFSDAKNLEKLYLNAVEEGNKEQVQNWTREAKKEFKSKRDYQKSIPDGYELPGDRSPQQVAEQLVLELDGNLELHDRGAVTEKRQSNRGVSNDIKGLFQGMEQFSRTTLDNAMLGLYSLGNFQNALCFEEEKPGTYRHKEADTRRYAYNMRNDPIEDASICFDDCEVEYLINGSRREKDNYNRIRNELTGLYFTLNYAAVRKPQEIRTAVDTTARAVEAAIIAATAGVGSGAAKIAYYATREACYAALALIQTNHDLERLYFGNRVPLLKKENTDFCGLELFGGTCTDDAGIKKVPIGYVDYLFIRMIFTKQGELRGRLQNLVEVNMNTSNGSTDTGQPFRLDNARTSATVRVEAEMPFFFINVIFKAEGLSGSGIRVSKSASQKY